MILQPAGGLETVRTQKVEPEPQATTFETRITPTAEGDDVTRASGRLIIVRPGGEGGLG